MRLAAEKWALQTRYPIYFVVKNHRLFIEEEAEP
jgi:hypothetical protein